MTTTEAKPAKKPSTRRPTKTVANPETKTETVETTPSFIIEIYANRNSFKKRQHYWRAKDAQNGKILAQGEGYNNATDRDATVAKLFPDATVKPTSV